MATLTEQQRTTLRATFKPKQVSWRPVITCPRCDQGTCRAHEWLPCGECGANITTAHDHVQYVGQAQVRERLFEVDPEWTWEPMATTPEGLPIVDAAGGLWIRLTVCGVTRIGYGAPEKGRGPNVTEAINRAIRFTARDEFGVGLYLLEPKRPKRAAKAPDTAKTAVAAVEDVPLPFDEQVPEASPATEVEDTIFERAELRRRISEVGARQKRTLPDIAQDFLGFSEGLDLLDPRVTAQQLHQFLEYLNHPAPEAVAS
jgi:hypothetical protein